MIDLTIPPTEIELAELTNAIQAVPEMNNILRRLIFERDMKDQLLKSVYLRCHGCNCNMMEDYCMLRKELWNVICENPSEYLCINCMEGRLGRQLTKDDFDWNAPVNHLSGQSDILKDRMKNDGSGNK